MKLMNFRNIEVMPSFLLLVLNIAWSKIKTGSETSQFGCELNCWINTKSFLSAWQIETFGLKWKSINWFAARCIQRYYGEMHACASRQEFLFHLFFHSKWQELKELKCRNCNIKKINPQVYNLLPQLGILDLGDNQVRPIHMSFTKLSID